VLRATAARGWLPTVEELQSRFYPDRVERDAVAVFVRQLDRLVTSTDAVLDLGAGAGELNSHSLKGRVRRVVGVDVDPRVGSNPLLDSGVRADIERLPFRDSSFDVVFSIYVMEHVANRAQLMTEITRVIRPGGVCVMLTPNIFHYVTFISRVTPIRFHKWVNRLRGRPAEDTFPTAYRLNSPWAVQRACVDAGLARVSIDLIEVQPNYLAFSRLSYLLGIAYERLVNSTAILSAFRVNLIAVFKKPDRRGHR
jgi:SAM-dependent methyltransferase